MADILSRDAILAARLRHEDVEVPEWGGFVRVWELSALRKLELRSSTDEDPERVMIRVVAACVGDENGPVGLPVENLSLATLQRLLEAAGRLNVATRKSAENVLGNSEGEPTGASPTGSP